MDKGLSTLMVAAALFGLAGGVVAVIVPHLFPASGGPEFTVFLVAGAAMIVLTALLFGFIDQLGMGFGRTALVLAGGYNALIGVVKLGLAPAGLYRANETRSFDTSAGDPNSPLFYVAVGTAVLFLYLIVFRVMYGLFKRRFRRRSGENPSEARTGESASRRIIPIIVVVAIVAILSAIFWIVPVFFVALPTLSYMTYIFAAFGVAIAAALLLAAFLAYRTFDEVEKQAARLGDAALLANFFWLGLSLILLYHVMWAIFLLTLVSIWPFRTYTPK